MRQEQKPDTFTCITSDTREGPWHAWLRAAEHVRKMYWAGDWTAREQMAQDCIMMARLHQNRSKPPKRAIGLQFGWDGKHSPQ